MIIISKEADSLISEHFWNSFGSKLELLHVSTTIVHISKRKYMPFNLRGSDLVFTSNAENVGYKNSKMFIFSFNDTDCFNFLVIIHTLLKRVLLTRCVLKMRLIQMNSCGVVSDFVLPRILYIRCVNKHSKVVVKIISGSKIEAIETWPWVFSVYRSTPHNKKTL